jgi:hypothetical protein
MIRSWFSFSLRNKPVQDRERMWAYFESKGELEIRKELGSGLMGAANVRVAQEWLAHKASQRSSEEIAASLDEAKRANALAREANSLAEQADASAREASASARDANNLARAANSIAREVADAAHTNNIITTLAFIAALIAIAISIVALFFKK